MTKQPFFLKALLLICLWMIFSDSVAYSSSFLLYDNHPELNKKYFDLLERIQGRGEDEKIDSLKQFIRENPRYSYTYFRLWFLYSGISQTDQALTYFTRLSLQPAYRFMSYRILAKHYWKHGDINLARKYYSLIASEDSLSFDFLSELTSFLYSNQKAKDLSVYHKFGIRREYDPVISFLLSFFKRDYPTVIRLYEEKKSDFGDNYNVLNIIAKVYHVYKKYAVEDSLYHYGLLLSRSANDISSEIRFLHNLALVKIKLEMPELSEAYFDTAIQKAIKINDLVGIQYGYGSYGTYLYSAKRFDEAAYYLARAIKIAKRIKRISDLKRWEYYYGNVLYEKKDFSNAIEMYNEGEKLVRESGDTNWLYRFLTAKGNFYEYLNQNSLAEKILQDAIQIAAKYGWQKQLFDLRARHANILLKEKRFEEARVIYRQNIDFVKRGRTAKDVERLTYWKWKFAQTFQEEKNYKIAKELFKEVAQLAQKNNLRDYYRWAVLGIAQCEDGLGNLDEAKIHYLQVLELLKKLDRESDEAFAEVYLGLGSVHRKAKEWRAAIQQFQLASSYVEKIRDKLNVTQFRLGYFSRETEAYDNLVECYFRLYILEKEPGCLDSLFYFEQMSKSRVLFEIQSGNRLRNIKRQNEPFLIEYKKAQQKLQADLRHYRLKLSGQENEEDIARLLSHIETEKYTLLEKRLALIQLQREKGQKIMSAFVVPFPEALKKLKESQVSLLMYHLSEKESFVLGVNGDKVALFPLKKNADVIAKKVQQLMAPFHNVAGDSILNVAFRADLAHELYQILVKPVEKSIGLSHRTFIVPDGELFSLSFEMLLSKESGKKSFTPLDSPEYLQGLLVSRYSFSYAPSPYFLNQKNSGIPSNSSFLIIANPVDPASLENSVQNSRDSLKLSELGPLPFAEAEAKRIKQVVSQAEILRRAQATESNFKKIAHQMKVLHLATHGLFDDRFDAFSGLFMALGNDTINDGLLLGYEISDLNLNCTLVTLSACETGRGKTVAGEGVLGLPRLFLGAGAKTVLMTLWKVDDQFTSELMPAFYKNLFQKKMVVADALSQAKLEVFKQPDSEIHYEHPFFWAAFSLYGEPTVFVKPFPWLKWIAILVFVLLDMASVVYFYFIRPKRNAKK